MCTRGSSGAAVRGPSTSPLDRTMQVRATLATVLILLSTKPLAADTPVAPPAADAPCNSPRLSEAAAIRIAVARLKRHKMRVPDFQPPDASCSDTAQGNTWSILFKEPAVEDGCFWLLIDDKSGKVNPIVQACG